MYDKFFTNTAAKPVIVPLIAVCNDDGAVRSVRHRRGYHLGLSDAHRAEVERIRLWANSTFVDQDITFFLAHNGKVPPPTLHVPNVMPGSTRLEDLDLSAEDREKIARAFGVPYEKIAEHFNTPYKSVVPHDQPGKTGAQFYAFSGDIDALKDNGLRRYVIHEDLDPQAIVEAMLGKGKTAEQVNKQMIQYALGIVDSERVLGIVDSVRPSTVNVEYTFNADDVIGDLEKWAKLIGTPPSWIDGVPMGGPYTGHLYPKDYVKLDGPIPGTYWQSRTEPTRFFKLTGAVGCGNHWHVEMHCLQDGEPEDRVWVSDKQWSDIFTQVDRVTAVAPLSPQSKRGPYTEHFDPAVFEARDAASEIKEVPAGLNATVSTHGRPDIPVRVAAKDLNTLSRPVGRVSFPDLVKPELDAEREALQPVVDATQQMLDAVEFTGKEAPPKVGEQYQNVHSDEVFTVVDVRKADMGAHTVTMDANSGGVLLSRTKHQFRNHAQWLAKWRPLGDDGAVKPIAFVDIDPAAAERVINAETTIALAEEDDKEAFAEVREGILQEDGMAVRWVRVIGRELDRRVPDWRDYDPPGVLYDDCALILRAIRTLNRRAVEAEKEVSECKDQIKAQLERANVHNKEKGKFTIKLEQRDAWSFEALRDATAVFKNVYGTEKTKDLLQEFGCATILDIPVPFRPSWVRKLREYAGANIP